MDFLGTIVELSAFATILAVIIAIINIIIEPRHKKRFLFVSFTLFALTLLVVYLLSTPLHFQWRWPFSPTSTSTARPPIPTGQNGVPANSANFSIRVVNTVNTLAETLNITNGKVCSNLDDGKAHTVTYHPDNNLSYVETFRARCTPGTYQNGHLSYTVKTTSFQVDVYAVNNLHYSCKAASPFIIQQLDGTFISPKSIKGTYKTNGPSLQCAAYTPSISLNSQQGSWLGTLL